MVSGMGKLEERGKNDVWRCNLPIIARHSDFDNLYLNTGHFRYGVTMAPASADMLADMVCDE